MSETKPKRLIYVPPKPDDEGEEKFVRFKSTKKLEDMPGFKPRREKKPVGRPKKIVMESSSSESEEEKPKKKPVGRPKKVVESSSSESEEEKPKKKPVGRPKKCSCGSGLNVEPYQKFFKALKENTTLK